MNGSPLASQALGPDSVGINMGRHLDSYNQAAYGDHVNYQAGHHKLMQNLKEQNEAQSRAE